MSEKNEKSEKSENERQPLQPLPEWVMKNLYPVSNRIPNNFSHHVILYAKHWYGHSGNIISDLKELLSVYSSIPIELVSDRDILQILSSTFAEYVSKFDLSEGIFEMLVKKEYIPNIPTRTPEQIMIGKIAIVDGCYCNPRQRLSVLSFNQPPYKE